MIPMKMKALFSFFLSLLLLNTSCAQKENPPQQTTIAAMDTLFSLTISGNDETVMQDCTALLTRLSAELDYHLEDSFVSTLNREQILTCPDGTLPRLLTETAALQASFGNHVQLTCRPLTDLWGITTDTPRIPTQKEILAALNMIDDSHIAVDGNTVTLENGASLDLGAVAKGYALDLVAERLKQSDIQYAVVSASSAVLLYGQKPDGKPFTLQVTDPNNGGALGTITIAHDEAQQVTMIGTSGGYERYSEIDGKTYSHVLDLQTGAPTESALAAATIICENGLMSDFLSTTVYLSGGIDPFQAEGTALSQQPDWIYLIVDREGVICHSAALDFTRTEVQP